MNRLPLGFCTRCRQDLSRLSKFDAKLLYRTRTHASVPPKYAGTPPKYRAPRWPPIPAHTKAPIEDTQIIRHFLRPADLPEYLAKNVKSWRDDPHVHDHLRTFGIDEKDIRPLISVYADAVGRREILSTLDHDAEYLERIAYDVSDARDPHIASIYLTKLLFEWSNHPAGQALLQEAVHTSTVSKMIELFQVADLSDPPASFPMARASRRRKVIMHVGPTNSGKTHNALRALAAARTGVYAGPLRLLAHEIWERLNKGQIVPLGAELDDTAEPDPSSNIDGADAVPIIRKEGSSKYARVCNMITGEEQRILQEYALVSCTVEMVPLSAEYEVAVIDEIQMIADRERGGAWTNAVLGLQVAELHLCGEETAVPLIKALLRDMGDELIVKRYERLTPLTVAEHSLHGDLSRVEKGDAFVTFSRSQLFAAKKNIEQLTGMRCAVAYGRLPPEIRSEQAALFNRPDSGYDVLVGSDAIGMGLNLKIKRVIFESVFKFDGRRTKVLSTSQIKQIAGRAGRYGLHGDTSSGGVAVTLEEGDLQVVRDALKASPRPLKFARVSPSSASFAVMMRALPPNTSPQVTADVYKYVSKVHPHYQLADMTQYKLKLEFLEPLSTKLTMLDFYTMYLAPVPLKDDLAVNAVRRIFQIYHHKLLVTVKDAFEVSGLLKTYQNLRDKLQEPSPAAKLGTILATLESIHKVLVTYLWLSYRLPLGFPDRDAAFNIRTEVEMAMERCLHSMTRRLRGTNARVARAGNGTPHGQLSGMREVRPGTIPPTPRAAGVETRP